MLRIGVLVSGGGTNLQAIIDRIDNKYIENACIATVVSSNPNAYALERAAKHNINNICIRKKEFSTQDEYEKTLLEHLENNKIDLLLTLGFVIILSEKFVKHYEGRFMNIHPSLIPSFCGKGFYGIKVHEAALEKGVKISGATVHFVDYGTDTGPIIIQKAVEVLEDDTPEVLQKRIMECAEWQIMADAINLFSRGLLKIELNKVHILNDNLEAAVK